LWKRIFKSIKAIRRKEIKTNVDKTDGFSIPLRISVNDSKGHAMVLTYRPDRFAALIRSIIIKDTQQINNNIE